MKSYRFSKVMLFVILMSVFCVSLASAQDVSPPATPFPPTGTPAPPADGGMDPELLGILQKALLLLIQVGAPILIGWAILLYKRHLDGVRQQDWFLQLEEVGRVAVLAAEQLELSGDLDKFAKSKLDYAMKYAEQALKAQGIPLDLDEPLAVLRMVIESQVREHFPH